MKPYNLAEFDLLALKFYHECELRRWQPGVLTRWTFAIRSKTVASCEQKNAI